jgi:glycosyltransferase involved in cell wall biosynthesis
MPCDPVGVFDVRILALTKYGDRAASTRQRVLQFRPFLEPAHWDFEVMPLLGNAYLERTFAGRPASRFQIARSYLDRLRLVTTRRDHAALWLQYELFPYLPGAIERLAFLSRRPVIYDFDDATFHQYDTHPNPLIRRLLGRKLEPLLCGTSLAICGNAYLEAYARRFCPRTEIVPTVVDTDVFSPAPAGRGDGPVTIGWIGSPSTWAYVVPYVPLLQEIAEACDLTIRVVGAGPQRNVPPRFVFLDWSEAAEVEMIRGVDIGIMPLPDEPWARGKCGYKLIQYMACGLPVVASPVGVNAEIVEEGVNGFLARDMADWAAALRRLVSDPALRAAMGQEGRAKIEREYSLQVQGPRLAGLIRDVVDRARSG